MHKEAESKKVTIKYGAVKNSQQFAMGFRKLLDHPTSMGNALILKLVKNGVTKQIDLIRKEFRDTVIEKYSARDEKGQIKTNPQNPDGFVPDAETFQDFLTAEKEFCDKTFTLPFAQLKGASFANLEFTANEMDVLDGLVDWSGILPEQEASPENFKSAEEALGGKVTNIKKELTPEPMPVETGDGETAAN